MDTNNRAFNEAKGLTPLASLTPTKARPQYRLKAPFQFQHRSEALHFHKLRAPWHTLPTGLKVEPIPIQDRDYAGKYWLEEFPPSIFPPNSIYLHDAEHYGIVIPGDFVEEVTDN